LDLDFTTKRSLLSPRFFYPLSARAHPVRLDLRPAAPLQIGDPEQGGKSHYPFTDDSRQLIYRQLYQLL
jgi:hypothetical protein